jgi:plastocyanin
VSTSCAGLSHISPLTDKGTQTASGSTVNLEADNDNGQFYFDPSCVKSSGGTLSVTIKNTGDVEHNFTIRSLNIDKDIEKGQSVTVSVKLPTSGVLQFYCEYHHASGMQGAFIVG